MYIIGLLLPNYNIRLLDDKEKGDTLTTLTSPNRNLYSELEMEIAYQATAVMAVEEDKPNATY